MGFVASEEEEWTQRMGGRGSGICTAGVRVMADSPSMFCRCAAPLLPSQGEKGGGGVPRGAEVSLVVFSGGTAFNTAASVLKRREEISVTYVLPVSDDGGSTAEIVRALGGPAVGDIRSRCLRLADDSDEESVAVKNLLAYRLTDACAERAMEEWQKIAAGTHSLWFGVSKPYKHTIRAFLTHFRSSIPESSFDFRNGSIGNFFFAGARVFFNSLEAAIFLFARVARVPERSSVLPALLSEERVSICAQLADGEVIRGQNNISHPSGKELDLDRRKRPHRSCCDDPARDTMLHARIQRIFYENGNGTDEAGATPVNPAVVARLAACDTVVYTVGSLFTSIVPSLILCGLTRTVAELPVPKVLVLNGAHDRETQWRDGCLRASDFVLAIAAALNGNNMNPYHPYPPCRFVTTVVAPIAGGIEMDEPKLRELGISSILYVPSVAGRDGMVYDDEELVATLDALSR